MLVASQVMLTQVSLEETWKMVSQAGGLGFRLEFRVCIGRFRKGAQSLASGPLICMIHRASLV